MKASSAKAKGARLESDIVRELQAIGIDARRQPGSGIYPDFPHDIELVHRGERYIVECKARKDSFRQLDGWLGKADLLIVRCDRATPRVYMHFSALKEMIGGTDE